MSDSFLDLALEDVQDLHVLDEGEHQVKCEKASVETSKKGGQYVRLDLIAVDDDLSKPIMHVAMLPEANQDDRQKVMRLARIKEMCLAFGVDISNGVNVDDFVGQTAWANLGIEDDAEYGEKNRVKTFIVSQ